MNGFLVFGNDTGTRIRLHATVLIFLAWIGAAVYQAGRLAVAVESIVFILLVFLGVRAHEFGYIAKACRFRATTGDPVADRRHRGHGADAGEAPAGTAGRHRRPSGERGDRPAPGDPVRPRAAPRRQHRLRLCRAGRMPADRKRHAGTFQPDPRLPDGLRARAARHRTRRASRDGDAVEPSPIVLKDTEPISAAIDALLFSPKKEFAVPDWRFNRRG